MTKSMTNTHTNTKYKDKVMTKMLREPEFKTIIVVSSTLSPVSQGRPDVS